MQDNTKNLEVKYPRITVSNAFKALGTDVEVRVVLKSQDEIESARHDIEECKSLYVKYSKIFSRFDSESELSKINSSLGNFFEASFEMLSLSRQALMYNEGTDGFFDPRILDVLEKAGYRQDFKKGFSSSLLSNQDRLPIARNLKEDLKIEGGSVLFSSRIDFSGIAKGFITDLISKFLKERGWDDFFVDSGGDMFLEGKDEYGKAWAVSIENVNEKGFMFYLSGKGVATSGINKRRWESDGKIFHHIINPKDPCRFESGLKAVSVASSCAMEADVLAKTLFLMGREKGMEYAKKHDIAAVFLDCRSNAWVSLEAKRMSV